MFLFFLGGGFQMGKRKFLYSLILFTLTGCSTVMDVLVPPHKNSNKTSPAIVCLKFVSPPEESVLPALAAVGGELLIAQATKGIEKESKRYKTTYSARTTGYLFRLEEIVNKGSKAYKFKQNVVGINISRKYGKAISELGCEKAQKGQKKPEETLSFNAEINYSAAKDAIKIKPTSFKFSSSKAKVADGAIWYYPWTWWMVFDSSPGKVDLNIQIEITIFGTEKSTTATIDFPMGKIDLDKIQPKKGWFFDQIESGWIPLPKMDPSKFLNEEKDDLEYAPINIKVTIIEANDLGDVIAKGGIALSDNKEKFLDFFKKE